MLEKLNFWHGFSLFREAVEEQAPQTPGTASTALPRFQEAHALLLASRTVPPPFDYPSSIDVDFPGLVQNVETYISIQETIIARAERRR